MLLTDTFSAYCKNLNDNIGPAIEYVKRANWKNIDNNHFPLVLQQLRQKFTTNTEDDYGYPIDVLKCERFKATKDLTQVSPIFQHPFYDMLKLVYQKNLIPNFFVYLDYIKQNHPSLLPEEEPDILLDFLAWPIFDEKTYCEEKNMQLTAAKLKQEEEARIQRNKQLYLAKIKREKTGKEQMKKITKSALLTARFMDSMFIGK